MIERCTGRSVQAAIRDLVIGPLGIEAYLGEEPPRPVAHVSNPADEHAGTELAFPNSRFWRRLGLPDAGLVTTPAGALTLVRAFHAPLDGFLSESLGMEACTDQTGGLPGGVLGWLEWDEAPWGLGVEIRGRKSPHPAPAEASPTSFGHSGLSGCNAWVDPERGAAWALMGTRVIDDWLLDPALPIKGALYS